MLSPRYVGDIRNCCHNASHGTDTFYGQDDRIAIMASHYLILSEQVSAHCVTKMPEYGKVSTGALHPFLAHSGLAPSGAGEYPSIRTSSSTVAVPAPDHTESFRGSASQSATLG